MTQANANKPAPSWMVVTDTDVTVTMKGAVEIGGVKTDKLTMRAPTIKDVRAAKAGAKDDYEQMELSLFCSLLQATEAEVLTLGVKNYNRLQAGYFRLVEEDEL